MNYCLISMDYWMLIFIIMFDYEPEKHQRTVAAAAWPQPEARPHRWIRHVIDAGPWCFVKIHRRYMEVANVQESTSIWIYVLWCFFGKFVPPERMTYHDFLDWYCIYINIYIYAWDQKANTLFEHPDSQITTTVSCFFEKGLDNVEYIKSWWI